MKNVAFLLGIIKSKKILKYILNHLEYHNKLIISKNSNNLKLNLNNSFNLNTRKIY